MELRVRYKPNIDGSFRWPACGRAGAHVSTITGRRHNYNLDLGSEAYLRSDSIGAKALPSLSAIPGLELV